MLTLASRDWAAWRRRCTTELAATKDTRDLGLTCDGDDLNQEEYGSDLNEWQKAEHTLNSLTATASIPEFHDHPRIRKTAHQKI